MTDDQAELFEAGPKQGKLSLAGPDADDGGQAGERSPLDVPQRFSGVSSYEVRDELEDIVRGDLLGPWDGETEQLPPKAWPRERYLVGMLGPKHAPRSSVGDAAEVPDTESGVHGDASEGELPEVLTPQSLGRIWASAMGLSFAVPRDADVVAVTASWGRYGKTEIESEDGKKHSIWRREPVTRPVEVRLDEPHAKPLPLAGEDGDGHGVFLAVSVRPQDSGKRVVELIPRQRPAGAGHQRRRGVAVSDGARGDRARRRGADLPARRRSGRRLRRGR